MDKLTEQLPVGTKIRFIRTLEVGPSSEHPALLFARNGQTGEVTGHNDNEGHWVKTDDWPTAFGAVYEKEFEVIFGRVKRNWYRPSLLN